MEQLIAQLTTLGWCWVTLGVLYLAWLGSGVLSVAYSKTRKWSWQIFWEDLIKLFTLGGSMVAFVVGVNLIAWLVWRMGGDISGLADDVSTAGLIGLLLKGGMGYASKAYNNYKNFIEARHSEDIIVKLEDTDYADILNDTVEGFKTVADAITPKHLQAEEQTTNAAEPDELELESLAVMFDGVSGQGADTNPLNRILPDGHNDNGKGWQCSKYAWYLATGVIMNYAPHPDYGPVNGNAMVDYLINKLGWVECTKMNGAIFSYNTGAYGHTGVVKDAKNNIVNDANWKPLTVGTHYLNLEAVGARYACPKSLVAQNTNSTNKTPQTADTQPTAPAPKPVVSTDPNTGKTYVDKPLVYHKGEKVVPLRKVDYDGRKLRQYDDQYYIVQDVPEGCDRVVLGARGQVWAAMRIEDIRRE